MVPSDPTPAAGRVVVRRSRLRVGIGAAVVLVLAAIAVAVLVYLLGSSGVSNTVGDHRGTSPSENAIDREQQGAGGGTDPYATGPPPSAVFVHLLGAVAAPGLYELRSGDRVVDAVAVAGGFAGDADQAGVNLARLVTDGEQIYVPRVGEAPPAGTATVGPEGTGGAAGGAGTAGKVNLNTADEAALDTLPGVGPATAGSILEWRETNGRFTAVEDLLSVSGIGDKTFADLKDLVTV